MRFTAVFIGLLMCLLCSLPSFADGENKNANKQASQLDKEIKALAKQKARKQKDKAKYEKQLKRKNKEIQKTQKRLTELAADSQKKQSAIEQIKQSISAEQADVERTNAEKKKLLVSTYKLTELDYMKLAFSQEDPNEVSRAIDYFAYLSQQRDDSLRTLRLSLASLQQKQTELEDSLDDLSQTQSKYNEQKKRLEQKNQERKKLIAKLGNDISATEKKLAKLKEDRTRVNKLIAKLKKQQESAKRRPYVPRKGGFAQQKGAMSYPVPGKITRAYGSRINNSRMTMNGVNIRTTTVTNVHAIYDGQVIFANALKGFGNLIIIDHGNNYMSLYGNNDVLHRRVGEEVSAGDTVAKTGQNTQQGDFYFEIRHKGNPVNPAKWCRR